MLQIHTSSSRAAWVRTLAPTSCGGWAAPPERQSSQVPQHAQPAAQAHASCNSRRSTHLAQLLQEVQRLLAGGLQHAAANSSQSDAPSTAQRRLGAPGGDTRTLRGTVSVPSTSNRASTRFPAILAAVGAETTAGEDGGASELHGNAYGSDQSNMVVVLCRALLPSCFCVTALCN